MTKKKAVEITEQQFVEMLAVGLDVVWDGWHKSLYRGAVPKSVKEMYLEFPAVLEDPPEQYKVAPREVDKEKLDIHYMAIVEDDSDG